LKVYDEGVLTTETQRGNAAIKDVKTVFTTKDTKITKFKNNNSETFVSFVIFVVSVGSEPDGSRKNLFLGG
jgi:hypothetical protein